MTAPQRRPSLLHRVTRPLREWSAWRKKRRSLRRRDPYLYK